MLINSVSLNYPENPRVNDELNPRKKSFANEVQTDLYDLDLTINVRLPSNDRNDRLVPSGHTCTGTYGDSCGCK